MLTQCLHLSHQKLCLNIFLIFVVFNCSAHFIEYFKFFHCKYGDWSLPKHCARVHRYRSFCIQGTACGVDKQDADELPFLPKCNFALNGSWLWRHPPHYIVQIKVRGKYLLRTTYEVLSIKQKVEFSTTSCTTHFATAFRCFSVPGSGFIQCSFF